MSLILKLGGGSKSLQNYHKWLKHNLNFGMELWQPGVHPPALLAFEGQVHPIDPSWHVGGLGYRPPQAHDIKMLSDAMVLHFSGPAKPWLDVGFPELRSLWNRHISGMKTEIAQVLAYIPFEDTLWHGVRPEGRRFCLQSLLTLASLNTNQ
ncbi:hypothetical protein NC652_033512 [Populus alba x Populus x berolinensis]|nr:hypothetical protein NC652_033512 [Populus alba x Populus x berolinensis]